jgi:enamine deaminase RidA (YjgF/YER057c/UK114 family)
MAGRLIIPSGTPFEPVYGYARAVRVGNRVFVSGTVASDEQGRVVGGDDMYAQAKHIIEKIGQALEQAGASLQDVVRTRTFVTDISRWQEVARAHAEFFGPVRPAATLVEVSRLIGDEFLVEIEADAVVHGRGE